MSGYDAARPHVEFGVLGPLSLKVDGENVLVRAPTVRIVLATLLAHPNRLASTELLIDYLWGDRPPRGARGSLQTYVNRLRNLLGPARDVVRTDSAGYRLVAPPESIDRERSSLSALQASRARSRGDLLAESAALREALGYWRGRPFADVPSVQVQSLEATPLEQERLELLDRRNEVDLELGRHTGLLVDLHNLTAEHPLRERFWYQLMLALYRSGRRVEALEAYRNVSTLLREELGLDPSVAIRNLHRSILTADTPTSVPERTSVRPAAPSVVCQLPADTSGFVGREDLFEQLCRLLSPTAANRLAVPLVVLSGPPGVGKTALAVHAAHRLRSRFPDGQLFVDLHGHSASPPTRPGGALERMLRALGVAAEAIAHDPLEQAALFRSTLADRKVLILLDNASSADQIRPLLPGTSTCAVLVTSRDHLHGLVALNGARRLAVPAVSPQEAEELLRAVMGESRVAAEPSEVRKLASLCGHLPLALRIVAANLASAPQRSLASAVRQLESGRRLDAMAIEGDADATVRRIFDFSYTALKPATAVMLELLSLVPGRGYDRHTAARLADIDPDEAERILEQLATVNLITRTAADRYQFHDLIDDYALERLQRSGRGGDGECARLFEYYVAATASACATAYSGTEAARRSATDTAVVRALPRWPDREAALHWLEANLDNLTGMIQGCRTGDCDLPVWHLASVLAPYLYEQRRDAAWRMVATMALAACERRGELEGAAAMHLLMGQLHFLSTNYAEAGSSYMNALQAFQSLDYPAGQARVLNNLGAVALECGEYDSALGYFEQSSHIPVPADCAARQVRALVSQGTVRHMIGDRHRALDQISSAQRLALKSGLTVQAGRAQAVLALDKLWQGDLVAAERGFAEVLTTWNRLGLAQNQAETMRNLAETSLEAGRWDESLHRAEEAASAARELGFAWVTTGAGIVIGRIHLLTGRLDLAENHLAAAREHASAGVRYWYAPATVSLAACHRLRGSFDLAVRLVQEVLDDSRPRERGRALAERARIALAVTDLERAREWADAALHLAARHGYRLDAARATAVLHAIAGSGRANSVADVVDILSPADGVPGT